MCTACLKVIGCDNRDSVEAKRDKYIMICWVGEKVSPMKKLGALESKKDAVTLFRGKKVVSAPLGFVVSRFMKHC